MKLTLTSGTSGSGCGNTRPRTSLRTENIGAEPVRPLCFLEAPELSNLEAKRKLAARVHGAIEDAYRGLANTQETLILMNHYPLENAGWAGRLQSDNREAVAAVKSLNGR